MLRICTDAAGIDNPRDFALFVKHTIEGLAYGCVSAYRQWQLPPLYQSGVRFAYEPSHGQGVDMFDLPPTVYRRGWGDCDDLVIWRICELVASGERATCRTFYEGFALHVAVRRANHAVEDPAIMLGAPVR